MPEYEGLCIYKHHAVLHSAHEIKLCGPAIVRTERMFENKLQYIKRRAKASNFRNPIHSVSPATYPAACALASPCITLTPQALMCSLVRTQVLRSWSLQTARDLASLASSRKHDVQITLVRDGCVVSEDLLPSLTDEPAYEVLCTLLAGGGSDLFWWEEVAAVELHSVELAPGCFVRHWSDGQPACLALISQLSRLRAEEDDSSGELWVALHRFPLVPMLHDDQVRVSAEEWMRCVAAEDVRETTFVVYEDLCFVLLEQHSMQGEYLFMR